MATFSITFPDGTTNTIEAAEEALWVVVLPPVSVETVRTTQLARMQESLDYIAQVEAGLETPKPLLGTPFETQDPDPTILFPVYLAGTGGHPTRYRDAGRRLQLSGRTRRSAAVG